MCFLPSRNLSRRAILSSLAITAVTGLLQAAPPVETEYVGVGSNWFTPGNWSNGVPTFVVPTIIDNGRIVIIQDGQTANTGDLSIGGSTTGSELRNDGTLNTEKFTVTNLERLGPVKSYNFGKGNSPVVEVDGEYNGDGSSLSVGGGMHVGQLVDIPYDGTLDASFNQDGGTVDVFNSPVFVGGGEFVSTDNLDTETNIDMRIDNITSFFSQMEMVGGLFVFNKSNRVDATTDIQFIDSPNVFINGIFQNDILTGNTDENQIIDYGLDIDNSTITMLDDFNFSINDVTGSGFIDHSSNLEIIDSDLTVQGGMFWSNLLNFNSDGNVYFDSDIFIDSSIIKGKSLNLGIRNPSAPGNFAGDTVLEFSFLELTDTVDFFNPAQSTLEFGIANDICFVADGTTRANASNIGQSGTYSAIDLNLTETIKSSDVIEINEKLLPTFNGLVIDGIIRFDYNGSLIDVNSGDQFQLIRINDRQLFIPNIDFVLEESGLGTGLTVAPIVTTGSDSGGPFTMVGIEVVSSNSTTSWDDTSSFWSGNSNWTNGIPNLGTTAVINNGGITNIQLSDAFVDDLDIADVNGSGEVNLEDGFNLSINDDLRIASPDSVDISSVSGIAGESVGVLTAEGMDGKLFVGDDLFIAQPSGFAEGEGSYKGTLEADKISFYIDSDLSAGFPESNPDDHSSIRTNAFLDFNEVGLLRIGNDLDILTGTSSSPKNMYGEASFDSLGSDIFDIDGRIQISNGNVSGSGNQSVRFDGEIRSQGSVVAYEGMNYGGANVTGTGSVFNHSDLRLIFFNRFDPIEQLNMGALGGEGGTNSNFVDIFLNTFEGTIQTGSFLNGIIRPNTPGILRSELYLDTTLLTVDGGLPSADGDFELGEGSVISMFMNGSQRYDDFFNLKGSGTDVHPGIDLENFTPDSTVNLDGRLVLEFFLDDRPIQIGDKFDIIRSDGSVIFNGGFDLISGRGRLDENMGLKAGIDVSDTTGELAYIVEIVASNEFEFSGGTSSPADYLTSGSWVQNAVPELADVVMINNGGAALLENDSIMVRDIYVADAEVMNSGTLIVQNSNLAVDNSIHIGVSENIGGTQTPGDTNGSALVENSDIWIGDDLEVGMLESLHSDGSAEINGRFEMDGGKLVVNNDIEVGGFDDQGGSASDTTTINADLQLQNLNLIDVNQDLEIGSYEILGDRNTSVTVTSLIENVDAIRVGRDLNIAYLFEVDNFGPDVEVNSNATFRNTAMTVLDDLNIGRVQNDSFGDQPKFNLIADVLMDQVVLKVVGNLDIGNFSSDDTLDVSSETNGLLTMRDSIATVGRIEVADEDNPIDTTSGRLALERSLLIVDPGFELDNEAGTFELEPNSETYFLVEGNDRATSTNYGQSGIYSAIDILEPNFSLDATPVELDGTLQVHFDHPSIQVGDRFDLITCYSGDFFSGDFDAFEVTGLPPQFKAEYDRRLDSGTEVLFVEIVQADLMFVGNNDDEWDVPASWNLNIIPDATQDTFINNGNTAFFDNPGTMPGAAKSLNIGTNGNSGELFFAGSNEDPEINIENDLNIGYSESATGDSNGSVIVNPVDFNFPAYFNSVNSGDIRVGVTDGENNATGSITNGIGLETFSSSLFDNFNDLLIGVAQGSGNATGTIETPDNFSWDLNNVSVGLGFGNGEATGRLDLISFGVTGDLDVGVSNGSGRAEGRVITEQGISGDNSNGSDILRVGVTTDDGDAQGNLNTGLVTTFNAVFIGSSFGEGNTTAFVTSSSRITGEGMIPVTNDFLAGEVSGDGSTFASISVGAVENFGRIRVGVVAVGTGDAFCTLDTVYGVDGAVLEVGTQRSGSGTPDGRFSADRGLSEVGTLTLGANAEVTTDINGPMRGSEDDRGYHAFDVTSATLDGELNIQFNYIPNGGDTFDLIRSGSIDGIQGNFAKVNASGLNNGLGIQTSIVIDGGVEVFRITITGTVEEPVWTNPGVAMSAGDWFEPTNWTTNRVPNDRDEAAILNGGEALIAGSIIKSDEKIIGGNARVFNLDAGLNEGNGSLRIENEGLEISHGLNVGLNTTASNELVSNSSSIKMNNGTIAHDNNIKSISSTDPTGELRGVNFGYSQKADVNVTGTIVDSTLFFYNFEIPDSELRIGVSDADPGNNASVTTDFDFIPSNQKNGGPSTFITAPRFEVGESRAITNPGDDLAMASNVFDMLFDHTEIQTDSFFQLCNSDGDGNSIVFTSGSVVMKNSSYEGSRFDFGPSDADNGATVTQLLALNISDSYFDSRIGIADQSDSDDAGTFLASIITADIKDTTIENGGVSIFGGPDARDGGTLEANFDVRIDNTDFINTGSWDIINAETMGPGSRFEINGNLEFTNSFIESNGSINIPSEVESDGGLASVTLTTLFDSTIIETLSDVDLAGEMECQRSSGGDTFVDIDMIFQNGSGINANNLTIAGNSEEIEVRENGILNADVDIEFNDASINLSNSLIIGEMETDDNGLGMADFDINLIDSQIFVFNEFELSILDDDSVSQSDLSSTFNATSSLIKAGSLIMSNVIQGDDVPESRLNLDQSYVGLNSLMMNTGATLSFDLNSTTRIRESDFKKQLMPTTFYSAIDVATTATLDGTLIVNDTVGQSPAPCERIEFLLIDADELIGDFDQVTLPNANWSLEIDRANGDVIAVYETHTTVTATYTAGTGGSIQGTAIQMITCGGSTSVVTAVPDTGFTFDQWSDGSTSTSRVDANLTDDFTVEAQFIADTLTATLSRVPNNPTNGIFTFTITFSDPVSGLETTDFTIQPSGLINMVTPMVGNDAVYTVEVIPGSFGEVMISLPANSVTSNVNGAGNEDSNILAVFFDGNPPTVLLTSNATEPVEDPFTVTATFNEDVFNFTIDDFTITNGTAANFMQINQSTYSVEVTPTGGGNVVISIAEDAAEDAASNGNDPSNELTIETIPGNSDLFLIQ